MIKKKLLKGTVAVAVASMGLSTIFPYNPTAVVEAKEAVATTQSDAPVTCVPKQEGTFTFGNKFLQRQFSITNGKFKTDKLINYRTGAKTELVPQTGSEEFVITTLDNGTGDGFKAPEHMIAQEDAWDATSDSEESTETGKGNANQIFDKDASTYWHSQYKGSEQNAIALPHNIYIDLKAPKKMKSFSYHKRLHNNAPTDNGHVAEFEIQKFDNLDDCKNNSKTGVVVAEGSFEFNKSKAVEYANFKEEIDAQYLRLVIKGAHNKTSDNKTVASIGEINFYTDAAVFPENKNTTIKSSEMTVKENGVNFDDKSNTLTVEFNPVTARNVEYTIKAIYTMKDGDSFMRKHLEISVPNEKAKDAKIDYIDLENMNFTAEDTKGEIGKMDGNFWTIPNQKDNPDMSGQRGKYLELGQPYYVGAMYWGCEFPVAENKIRANNEGVKNGFVRYYYGKNLTLNSKSSDGQFNHYVDYNGANGQSGKMVTWDTVVGAARSTDYQVCQADFYEYIETIATKTDFRQQFNSWYDNMKDITSTNILDSFAQVEKGFTQYGVNPLDSYVVDDGWQKADSLWTFNHKFPNQLYDSSLQVHQMGSNFGLWLGPRGGYGETVEPLYRYLIQSGQGSRNEQKNDVNISDSRYLNGLTDQVFLPYQQKFDINYWKLDGMLWAPSRNQANAPYHVVGENDLYTVSETYERWTDMYEKMRDQRESVNGDLWINMTSYANPSPWFLQWVNSLWMQNTGDTGFDYKFSNRDQQRMLTYRDGDYYDFFNENQWQLPNKYFYNHDPVYAKTAHKVDQNRHEIVDFSTDELREHLYMLGTRGTAFWEYYYSPSMFDEGKWQVNAESANWIEENFDILQKSKMFGGNPEEGKVYGYSCWNGNEGVVSIRNPFNKEQTYTLTLDRLVGVPEDLKDAYGKVIIGDMKYQTDKTVKYGDKLTYTLKPQETVIIQYGKKDATSAVINSIHTSGKTVEVEFNETIREVTPAMFTVDGYKVEKAQLQADLRTVTLTLNKEVKDLELVKVTVKDVKDTVGNTTSASYADDYYKNDVINGIVNVNTKGEAIHKGNKHSIDGNKGFSVVGELSTTSTNAVLAQQDDTFKVGIDGEGYLTFEFNGMNVNSKYTETLMKDGSPVDTVKGKINDGKKHTFAAVKEVNGMIKLYIDGKVVASKYVKDNLNPTLVKNNVSFAQGLTADVKCISLMDKALAFDEIASYTETVENVALSRKGATITAYDNTIKGNPDVSNDKPLSNIIDGNRNGDNYGEFRDTNNGKHSRYIQVTLKDSYKLNKINLTRYHSDTRKYGATVIALYEESDKEFKNPTVVYNSDKENVHGLGKGKDEYYVETAQGLNVDLTNVKNNTKVIRVYVNGRDNNTTHDHIVELEAYGSKVSQIPTRIDYTVLESLVNTNLDAFTKDSVKAYEKAVKDTLAQAKKILKDRNEKTTATIDRLVAELSAKQAELLVARANVQPAKDALAKLEGLNKNDYTKASWNAFVDAKVAVENVVKDNSNTSDAQLADLLAKLDAAYKALEKVTPEKPNTDNGTTIKPVEPKPENKPNKDETGTGDVTSMTMFASMLAASGVAVTAMVKRRNKK